MTQQADYTDILRQRAHRLAARKDAGLDDAETWRAFLTFEIDQVIYAVDIGAVAEAVPMRGCSKVPGAPAAVQGVINLRGEICPVVDLAGLLGAETADPKSGQILVLRGGHRPVGARVERIDAIRRYPAQAIKRLDVDDGVEGALGNRLTCGILPDSTAVIDAARVLALVRAN